MTYTMSGSSTTARAVPGATACSSSSSVVSTARSPSQTSQTSQLSLASVAPNRQQQESTSEETTPLEKKDSPGRAKLRTWLHSLMSVVLSDGRTLVGTFVCTDRDANIILSSCTEHLPHTHTDGEEEARMLGLAMVPGRHVVSLSVDERTVNQRHHHQQQQLLQHQEQLEERSSSESQQEVASSSQQQCGASGGAKALDPPAGYT